MVETREARVVFGVDFDFVEMLLVRSRAAFFADDFAARIVNIFERIDLHRMRMVEHPPHEACTARGHDRQQHGAHDREAEDAAEHDVAGPHRLGDDRVNCFRFEIVRQAEDAEQQRNQQHEQRGPSQHVTEEQLARLLEAGLQVPAGEQQDHDVDGRRDDDAAPDRFFDRQPGDRPHAPRRGLEQLAKAVDDHPIRDVAGLQRPVANERDQKADDERQDGQHETRQLQSEISRFAGTRKARPRVAEQPG